MVSITLTPLEPTPFGQTSVDPVPITPPILLGTGDEQHNAVETTGSMIDIRTGTSSAPDLSQNPALKVTRTLKFPHGTFANAATEQNAAIMGIGVSLDDIDPAKAGAFQPIGVLGVSKQYSTASSVDNPQKDALGVMGIGRAMVDSGMAVYGGFFASRRDHDTPDVTAVEIQAQNFGIADAYESNGNFETRAMTIHAAANTVAVGISIHKTLLGSQFDVGIGFSQSTGGPASKTANIRMDASVPYGLYFGQEVATISNVSQRGCYTGAIVMEDAMASIVTAVVVAGGGTGYAVDDILHVAGGSGTACTLRVATLSGSAIATVTIEASGSYTTVPTNPVGHELDDDTAGTGATFTLTTEVVINNALLMGVTSRAGTATNALAVFASSYSATNDPLIWMGSTAGSLSHYNRFGNGSGEFWHFATGVDNDFGTSAATPTGHTVAGDTGIQLRSAGKAFHIMVTAGVGLVRQKMITVVNGVDEDDPTPDTPPKLSFHGVPPVAKRASAAQAAVATTAATNAAPYGFTTAAQADAIVTLVNELRAAIVELGLIKGSA